MRAIGAKPIPPPNKKQRKNIVIPEVNGFGDWYFKSLEEFGITGEAMKPIELYNA